jgi:hypothetical protein
VLPTFFVVRQDAAATLFMKKAASAKFGETGAETT